jgi:HEPN domain-containing protein
MTIPIAAFLEGEDEVLSKQGVPLRYRALDCFTKLYGAISDGPAREVLFEPIISWYLGKYGTAARWDGVVGRFPILIKGSVYLAAPQFVRKGTVVRDWKESIENLPGPIASSVSLDEFRHIAERLSISSTSYAHLYNLRIDHSFLDKIESELVQRALYDLENSAIILNASGDTQSAVFMAHQATEKFLKAALRKSGDPGNLKTFGHNLPKLIQSLLLRSPRYRWLDTPSGHLQNLAPSMELRYGLQPRTLQDAVSAIHASLYVCGSIALMWQFDYARGIEKSSFKAGRFYLNGMWQNLYCKSVLGKKAVLTLFTSDSVFGSQMADLQLDELTSSLYLEVMDPREDARLRQLLIAHLRNPGRRVRPEEIGLSQTDGPEGSYLTAMLYLSRKQQLSEEHPVRLQSQTPA